MIPCSNNRTDSGTEVSYLFAMLGRNVSASLTRIRRLAADLSRELSRPHPSPSMARTITETITQEADAGLRRLKTTRRKPLGTKPDRSFHP